MTDDFQAGERQRIDALSEVAQGLGLSSGPLSPNILPLAMGQFKWQSSQLRLQRPPTDLAGGRGGLIGRGGMWEGRTEEGGVLPLEEELGIDRALEGRQREGRCSLYSLGGGGAECRPGRWKFMDDHRRIRARSRPLSL